MSKLYTPNLLALATQLSDFPLNREFSFVAQGRSRTCGSTLELGVDLDGEGRVSQIGLQISACAIGQASAAIMAMGVRCRSVDDISATTKMIEAWLASDSLDRPALPDWPQLNELEPAHSHKGRHGALLLAWTTLKQALSSGPSSR